MSEACYKYMILITQMPKKYHFNERVIKPKDFITIAQLTDFHYDPLYAPGSSSVCMESDCCRNTSIVSKRCLNSVFFVIEF